LESRAGAVPLQLTQGCIVASIQGDLDEKRVADLREDLLALLHRTGARGVILDVAGVEILDLTDFDALRKTLDMAKLLGARCLVAGLRPGVVSSLIDLAADVRSIDAVLDLDDAFRAMQAHKDGNRGDSTADLTEAELDELGPEEGGEGGLEEDG
jgi:rsbT antagonist protein RsbS